MSLRFAAAMPWCREAAILAVVIACIAMSGSAPAVKTHEVTVAGLATALTANAKFNDTNISAAKRDESRVDTADIIDQQRAAEPDRIELASVSPATPAIAQRDTTAATPAPIVVASAAPELKQGNDGHFVACHLK